jgi:hypothetical protein
MKTTKSIQSPAKLLDSAGPPVSSELPVSSRLNARLGTGPAVLPDFGEKIEPHNFKLPTPKRVTVAAIKMRKVLAKRFPKCFQGFGKPKLPLKIGILEDVFAAAPELSRRSVLYAIADYVSGSSYLQAHIEGAARFDLKGEAVGFVTAADEQYARERLARLGGTVVVAPQDITTLIVDGKTIEQACTRDKYVEQQAGYAMVPVRPAGPGWFIHDSSSDKKTVWRRKAVRK